MEKPYTASMGVLFRGLEDGHIICDIKGIKSSKKIRLDNNNRKLLEKVGNLHKRRRVWITYQKTMPLSKNTEDMIVTNLLTKDEYMILYEPYNKMNKRLFKENMKKLRKNKLIP